MKVPLTAAAFALVASVASADPLNCVLTAYKAMPGLTATVAGEALAVTWDGDEGAELRLRVGIEGGTPTPLGLVDSYDVLPSPSGGMIYYATEAQEKGADRNRPDRWVGMSSSDRTQRFAFDSTGDTTIGMMTNWAPDESGLDYVVTRNGVSNIWRQPLTGGPPGPITHFSTGRIFSFAWSPDGRWLSLGSGIARSDVVLMGSER